MKLFDTSLQPFSGLYAGRLNSHEVAKTITEIELGIEFQSHIEAQKYKKLYLSAGMNLRERRQILLNSRSEKDRRIGFAMGQSNLEDMVFKLLHHFSRWRNAIVKEAALCEWNLLSIDKALLQRPIRSTQPVLVRFEDILVWLTDEIDPYYASVVEAKYNLTVQLVARNAGITPAKPADNKTTPKWPWGRHNTYLLGVLAKTADEWVMKFSPTNDAAQPLKQTVIDWIVKEHSPHVSAHVAGMIYTILRPDDMPKGRPRKC